MFALTHASYSVLVDIRVKIADLVLRVLIQKDGHEVCLQFSDWDFPYLDDTAYNSSGKRYT